MQWIQYSIIADVVVKFYGVSYSDVNLTAMGYLILYVIFFYPGIYLLEKLGLRWCVLVGMLGSCIGAWLKIASAVPSRYWLLLLGQFIVNSFQVLLQPIPPKLASTWFGPNEVSTACSAGIIGYQVGEAVGLLFPPLVVNTNQSFVEMQDGFQMMAYGVAGISTVILVLLILFFEDKPPHPPSIAQMKIALGGTQFNIWKSVKSVLQNPAYLLILAAFGANGGVYLTLLALLNQIVLHYYPDAAYDAGIIGLLAIVSGILGSILTGIVLDKYRRYKTTALVSLTISFTGMAVFTLTASKGISIVYVLITLLGCSLRSMTTTAFEAAAEVTYPEPVGISGGILITVPQAIASLITYLYSHLFYNYGAIYANLTLCAIILCSIILVVCIRFDLKRNNAQAATNEAK